MGYICHHAILVTSFSSKLTTNARNIASTIFFEAMGSPGLSLITPISESYVNGYFSFSILPDGSKENWSDSEKMDACRDAFICWLKEHANQFSWAEVQYGDERGNNRILRHSGASE